MNSRTGPNPDAMAMGSKLFVGYTTSAINSISTQEPNGICATPNAITYRGLQGGRQLTFYKRDETRIRKIKKMILAGV